ncbi:MAG: S-methyl-5'-thioadenosine phosphorylase [Sphingomonadales bacterium]
MKNTSDTPVLGIIGGSGIYEISGLENARWERVDSAFGKPSDELFMGELDGQPMVFLPRHGRGHRLSPSGINYRANIDILKRVGVTDIISMSACGSFREELAPGTFVLTDQFIDRTFAREKSFFGDGLVAHVSMAHPVCGRLGDMVEQAVNEAGISHRRGGTYLAMEGPQFSSLAESQMYRAWGCDVIGMTNMPEVKLAREAEICYVTVAMVTDYDCWHPGHEDVEVADIIGVLLGNAERAKELVRKVAPKIRDSGDQAHPCAQGCDRVLDAALITAPEARDSMMLDKLEAVAGRVLRRQD